VTEFFARLKQRKLVQWALAYIAAAFALIQVLDVVAQRFGWPESIERVVIVALAIGFFVVLVLAWYHGERGAQRVTGTELLILALLLVIGGGLLWRMAQNPTATAVANHMDVTAAGAPAKSIAVLPFTDLSPGHDQEYFSDGMAEEILNALAKVKDLKVAGRTSSFSFKGKNEDLRAVGKALAVAHVLEGSVRKQGDKVRITAQLIQAEDGYHLWSENYDGDLKDVFELQERIARAITEKLSIVLNGDSARPLVRVATTNPEAYALYLQASGIFNRREGARFPEAITELEQALKLDPKFARAHARLAAIDALEPIYVVGATEASREATEREAALASALDPTLAEPYAALGAMYGLAGRWTDARIASDRSLAIDADDVNVVFWAGVGAINSGYTRRGCELLDRVLASEPLLPNALLWRGIQYVYAGDLAHGETLLRRAADVGLAHVGIGLDVVEAAHGRKAEAKQQLTNGLRALAAGLPADAPAVVAAGVYGDAAEHASAVALIEQIGTAQTGRLSAFFPYSLLRLGESTRALRMLQQQSSSNNALFMHVIWSPAQRLLRSSPEFKTFTHQIGLDELWDRYGPPDTCKRLSAGDYSCD
jgi:TolB-like protein